MPGPSSPEARDHPGYFEGLRNGLLAVDLSTHAPFFVLLLKLFADVHDELEGAGIAIVEGEAAEAVGRDESADEGAVARVLPEPVVGEALEDDVEQDHQIFLVAGRDQLGRAGEALERLVGSVDVAEGLLKAEATLQCRLIW